MKLSAILLATIIAAPAFAQEVVIVDERREDAKLDAIERQPLSATERAHIAAMKRAGVTDNTVDPYTVDRYMITETGEVVVEPKENVVVYRIGGNKHEDRTDAVVTGTKAYLNN